MSRPLNQQISELVSEISKLETDLERQRKSMEGRGLLSFAASEDFRQRNWPDFQLLDNLERSLDYARQRLVSLELISINTYSDTLNQNIQTLNSSVKSLETSTNKLVKSSTKLEYLTAIVILVAVLAGGFSLLPVNPFYS